MSTENFLSTVGEFGRFQKFLIAFYVCLLTASFRTFVIYNDVMLTITPDFWCKSFDHGDNHANRSSHISEEKIVNRRSDCNMPRNVTKLENYSYEVEANKDIRLPCINGYEYDFSGNYYPTAATQLNLVCDKKYISTVSHLIFWLSFQIGGSIFGFISDRSGRVPSAAAACFLGFVAATSTTFPFHWIFYLCSRSLQGFSFSGMVASGLTLATEIVGASRRTTVVLAWATTCTMVNSAFPWLVYFLRDWKKLTWITSSTFLIVPLISRFLPESPKWLVANKKTDEAVKIFKRISEVNGIDVSEDQLQKIKNAIDSQPEAETKATILDLFRTPNLRKITILVTLCWAGASCLALGLTYLSADLSSNFYFSISMGGMAEFAGCLLQILFLEKLGRRGFTVCALFVTAMSLSCVSVIPKSMKIVKHIFILCGRTMSSAAFNTAFLYHTELFPTVARAQGVGVRFAIGNIGAMMAPMIASLFVENEILPFMIFAVIAVFTCIFNILLPETCGEELPQTLEDGENFGKNQKLLSCFGSNSEIAVSVMPEKWSQLPNVF